MFKRILIANRGEIAVRIIRACRELGIESIAVYSDADRAALHVREADHAYPVGPAPAAESYLNTAKILEAAKRLKADAVHPGYGFFSERAAFARAVQKAGLTWIGPPPDAIEQMGDKVAARKLMSKAGVPVVPGSPGTLETEAEVAAIAKKIGYPIMVKAAAGGDGKGLRFVENGKDLASVVRTVASEAKSSFGDGRFYVEKFLKQPRHIEVQVLADSHGNTVHLFERECSIQRRNQKIVEESPSPFVTPEMRAKMGEVAVRAAKAVNYVGAGTIEFLADADRNFYFLEMNTRIQVEHPVTEMVTGIDLVRATISIAQGHPLEFTQSDITTRGAAIEVRINAEDPDKNFRPSPGRIGALVWPAGPGVRVDTMIYPGYAVPPYYDSLLAKIIVHAETRNLALARLQRALDEFEIEGVTTTASLHRRLAKLSEVRAAQFDTGFLERLLTAQSP